MITIEKSKYEGYLWCSNKVTPRIIDEEFSIQLDENVNPFIVEGWLRNDEKAISIKYIDGEYLVNEYKFDELNQLKNKTTHEFLPSFKKGIEKLCFTQYWRPVEDENCEGMEVLQPAEFVFTGFIKQ